MLRIVSGPAPTSVVVPGLEKVNTLFSDPVNEPVLLRDTSRPASGKRVSERLGFTQPLEGVAQHRFNQVQHPDCYIAVGLDPIAKILPELGLEDSEPFKFLCHREFRVAIQLRSRPFPYPVPPASVTPASDGRLRVREEDVRFPSVPQVHGPV
jgi:hypothetical protein